MNLRFLILIVFLIAILNGCAGNLTKDVSESDVATSSNSEFGGRFSCDQMVSGLESPDKAASEEMKKAILTNSQQDARSYGLISSCLIGKLTGVCSEDAIASHDLGMISEIDFDRIRNIGNTLAGIKNPDTIPILIDCSDRTRAAGDAIGNYPAVGPLLQFGDDAIPLLLQKYEDANSAEKCRVASILKMMPSSKAAQSLRDLLSAEKDPNVGKCLLISVRADSN